MTLDELKEDISEAIERAGFVTNGDTWKKEGVAYLAVDVHETGVAVSGRVYTDDGLSYTFTGVPLMYRFTRKTVTPDLWDKFVETLLTETKSLAEAGELPIYERSGAL